LQKRFCKCSWPNAGNTVYLAVLAREGSDNPSSAANQQERPVSESERSTLAGDKVHSRRNSPYLVRVIASSLRFAGSGSSPRRREATSLAGILRDHTPAISFDSEMKIWSKPPSDRGNNLSEIPCRVSSDLHEWRNDFPTVSTTDPAKLKYE
jgi:hypothetical protein